MKELLDAIVANPADDAVRRVYADALLDQGEPLGELIHVQLDLAAGGMSRDEGIARRRRERELFREHVARWTEPLGDLVKHIPTYRRGFVDEVIVDARVFAERGAELFAAAPLLRAVVLDGLIGNQDYRPEPLDPPGDVLARFAAAMASPAVAHLQGLHVYIAYVVDNVRDDPPAVHVSLGREALPSLVSAAPRLRALAYPDPGPEGVRALADAGLFAAIERANLWGWSLPSIEIALAAMPHLRSCALPRLPSTSLIPILARLANVVQLGIEIDRDAGDEVSAALTSLSSLRRLELFAVAVPIVRSIAESPALANVVELEITTSSFDGLRPLLDPPRLDALRVLRCRNRYMSHDEVRGLLASPLARRLELVDLRINYGAHQLHAQLPAMFDGVVLASEHWGVWFPSSVYEQNHHFSKRMP